MKYYLDIEKILEKVFNGVKAKYFDGDPVYHAKIQYLFWDGEKRTSDGRLVRGETRIPPTRERDIYGFDFIISIDEEYWKKEATLRDQIRLAYHELKHCVVLTESKNGKLKPKFDKEGRLKVKIRQHDINLNLFLDEVSEVGLTSNENRYIYELGEVVRSSDSRLTKGKR